MPSNFILPQNLRQRHLTSSVLMQNCELRYFTALNNFPKFMAIIHRQLAISYEHSNSPKADIVNKITRLLATQRTKNLTYQYRSKGAYCTHGID